MFSFSKTEDELVGHKYCKMKLFCGAIPHGTSSEPEFRTQSNIHKGTLLQK